MEIKNIPEPDYSLGKDYDLIGIWTLSKTCNFQCDYCFYSEKQMGFLKKTAWNIVENIPKFNPFRTRIFSPKEARAFFDSTKKTWRIYFSGGEPFIYPNFIEMVKELTQNHRVVLYTNLSTQIDNLIKEINPEKVDFVYASLHLGERRKMNLKVEDFILKVEKLTKSGFKVLTDFVLYPPLIEDYYKILEKFQKKDLFIEAKIFRGVFEGKKYPDSFTQKQRKEFLKYVPHPVDKAYSYELLSFKGQFCSAGHNLFRILPSGLLTRCPDYEFPYLGDISKKKFNPHPKTRPCTVKYCNCNVAAKEGVVKL